MLTVLRLASVVLAVALPGCGSGPSSSSPPAAPSTSAASVAARSVPVTHSAFVHRLDATCRGNAADLKAAANAAGDDTGKLAGIMREMQRRMRPVVDAQRHLHAPPGDREAFGRYRTAQQRLLATYGRIEDALRADDIGQVEYLLTVVGDVRRARTRAALDLGLRRCGS